MVTEQWPPAGQEIASWGSARVVEYPLYLLPERSVEIEQDVIPCYCSS
jgi:hypothetical protein